MNSLVFLKQISYVNDKLAYLTIDCNLLSVKEIFLKKKVYLFCKREHVESFIQRLQCTLVTNEITLPTSNEPRFLDRAKSINVRQISKCVCVQTNGGNVLSALTTDSHSFNECLEWCSLFVVQTSEDLSKVFLEDALARLQLVFPFFYILWPSNLEMEFVLDNLYNLQTNNFRELHGGFIRVTDELPQIDNLFTPIGFYRVLEHENQIVDFRKSFNNNSKLFRIFQMMPIISFAYAVEMPFEKSLLANPICYIGIAFGFFDQRTGNDHQISNIFYIHLCVRDAFLKKVQIDIQNPKKYSSDENECYEFFDNETLLLKRFADLYIKGDIFSIWNNTECVFPMKSPERLHWLLMDDCVEFFASVLDRVFICGIENFVVPHLNVDYSNEKILFNKFSFLISPRGINCSSRLEDEKSKNYYNFYETHVRINYRSNIQIEHNNINFNTVSTKRLYSLKYISNAVNFYNNIQENDEITLYTIFDRVNMVKVKMQTIFQNFNISNVLLECLSARLNVNSLYKISCMKLIELQIFYKYLEAGTFLLPSFINTHVEPVYLENLLSTNLNTLMQCPIFLKEGGYTYGKSGFYKNVSHLDFQLFYASIMKTFNLSFENCIILQGANIKFIIESKNLLSFFVKNVLLFFNMDFTKVKPRFENLDSFEDNDFYALVFKSLSDVYGKKIINLSSVCFNMFQEEKNFKLKMNSLVGCLGNENFSFSSNVLYNIVTAIGRRIVNYVCLKIYQKIYSCDENDSFDDFVHMDPLSCSEILFVQTDGIFFLDKNMISLSICEYINDSFAKLYENSNLNLKLKFVNYGATFVLNKKIIYAFKDCVHPRNLSFEEQKIISQIQLFKKISVTNKLNEKPFLLICLFFQSMAKNYDDQVDIKQLKIDINTNGFEYINCVKLFSLLNEEFGNNFNVKNWIRRIKEFYNFEQQLKDLDFKFIVQKFLENVILSLCKNMPC